MTLRELVDIMQTSILVIKKLDGTHTVEIAGLEIESGGAMVEPVGKGKTKLQAIRDLIKQIKGRKGIIIEYFGKKREYPLPNKIEYKPAQKGRKK